MIQPKKQLNKLQGYDTDAICNYEIKLDFNENLIGPSKKVLDAIKKISPHKIKFYPNYCRLLDVLSTEYNIKKENILPTNGGDEALSLVINTFVEPDENIISVSPSFVMPKIYSRISNVEFREIPYKEKWVYPIDDVLNAIDEKTKIILVTSPNSPTGEIISDENLRTIITQAPNILVMIDATYSTYAYKNYTPLVEEFDNVAIIKSFSKDFALAGLRLGCIITKEEYINAIKTIASPYSVNSIAALAGAIAIEDTQHIKKVQKEIEKSKEYLTNQLQCLGTVYPSDSNFLCIDFGEKATAIYNRLLENGIKTKFHQTGMLKNHFRLTIPPLNIAKKVVEVIKKKNLLIFDMDGVLIDVENSYRLSIQKTFEHFAAKPISPEAIQEAKNQGGLNNDWDLTEYLLKKEDINIEKTEIINKFQEFYFGENGNGLIQNEKLLIGKNILKNLAKNNHIALFTGRPKVEAMFSLDFFGIREYFSEIVTMDDLDTDLQKPNPYGIFMIMSKINPVNTFYFGDTIDDMLAAKGARVKGIGVLPPSDKSKKLKNLLKSNGASTILKNINEIIKLKELK